MRITRRLLLHCGAALPLASGMGRLHASPADEVPPAEVAAELPSARLLGTGQLRFLGLRVYDARLWALPAFELPRFERHPFALELHYLRDLEGRAIAERSLAEMQRIAELPPATAQRWLATLQATFPDVRNGDRIAGVHGPQQGARFYRNGQWLDEIAEPEFSRRFFAIWLSPRTSKPALRAALTAGAGGRR